MPHITIIRPIKGLEPLLYECLASTFQQTYPHEKLTVYFCVSSRSDPAVPTVHRLLEDHSHFDAKLLVEDEDEHLQTNAGLFGPNPKIRNMSRAYRESRGDLIWIIDCNVWVTKGVAGRLVDTIEGWAAAGPAQKQKFVHQLPLVVDVTVRGSHLTNAQPSGEYEFLARSTSTAASSTITQYDLMSSSPTGFVFSSFGARLEELFLSSSHAKFYTSINTVLVAPCIVGKSNMFRRSHLDALTSDSPEFRPQGIDHFSQNICEDHLIGDLLWKYEVPEETDSGKKFGKHAMVFGDLAIQPMAHMSVGEYMARRVRWLRVRKFTVPAATLIEPSTESFLCSVYGAYGVTTNPWVHDKFSVPQTWLAFAIFWLLSVSIWACIDWSMYRVLHSMKSVAVDEDTPSFARHQQRGRRRFKQWLVAWVGREALAFPIWLWAIFGGATVMWRGQSYWVGMDMKVHAVDDQADNTRSISNSAPSRAMSRTPERVKARRE